ncbi:hypothetical protein [Sporosarcina newyorkensis]|uniref:hypothetical protein n=1 Tax=Sporosarcina newyorkensis TaxID=759851 RepID=UPI003D05D520
MNFKTENINGLIDHLEKMLERENANLTNVAIAAMEGKKDSPFSEVLLVKHQREYKLKQQRILGIIDTIEEIKAYTEGYYDKGVKF